MDKHMVRGTAFHINTVLSKQGKGYQSFIKTGQWITGQRISVFYQNRAKDISLLSKQGKGYQSFFKTGQRISV